MKARFMSPNRILVCSFTIGATLPLVQLTEVRDHFITNNKEYISVAANKTLKNNGLKNPFYYAHRFLWVRNLDRGD